MAIDLSLIDTIVIVMMENRSFDHLLGYLSLPDWTRLVNGCGLTMPGVSSLPTATAINPSTLLTCRIQRRNL